MNVRGSQILTILYYTNQHLSFFFVNIGLMMAFGGRN